MRRLLFGLVVFVLAVPSTWAHAEAGGMGFVEGLTHPVLGLDHLLAMVAVGVLAAVFGKKSMWIVPGIFVGGMAIGGAVGLLSVYLPAWMFEAGIAASVLLLGLVLAVKRDNLLIPSTIAIVFFGFFHGYAHGVEMPSLASPWVFALGFLLGTTGLHLAGVGVGSAALKLDPKVRVLRVAGGAMAAFGAWLLIGLL